MKPCIFGLIVTIKAVGNQKCNRTLTAYINQKTLFADIEKDMVTSLDN